MANQLDELTSPVNNQGNDVNVINKQLEVKIGLSYVLLEILAWIFLIIPGIIILVKKIKAKQYFDQLQQKIQRSASQVDNYLEQRVIVLQNTASLVQKSITLDKDVMLGVAELRSTNPRKNNSLEDRNDKNLLLDGISRNINIAFEKYPELNSIKAIQDAIQQNSQLQKEITASREYYNDNVSKWNTDIFKWYVFKYVAGKNKFTTRIPFSTSAEIKSLSKSVLL
ncbi:LemA family protein [Mycoplasma crocodyli]|uniref:LemA family protein n=1 Tax=Mycoplasma crocodyli (strain ATCC 51981 / MP145) TaxID=512564 RepID=D5E4M5_MYCCM|nr:LemA family protein [Mycoplasma crocodyli]ADE19526.1 LemA protein of unknown function [Mycoplasma crocodyli MP145]